ncbi:MAG: HAMP domain-containing protein, partial [Alphaproteobacteria bacterium]|nr:HAMP domain-containing protein [Alphaproteobacteria bacterium]
MNADAQLAAPRSNIGRFADWAQRVRLERKLVIALLVGAVTAGIATFAAMTESLPAAVDTWVILLLLLLDLALLLCLGALIARRLVILHFAAKSGVAGARLHARLVALFSLVAVTPTIIVATFSVLFFDFGLQGWFSQRVRTAVEESVAVAQAYLEEHLRTINADALAMAQDLNREGPLLLFNPQRFNQFLAAQAGVRSLTEAMVFDRSGHTLARAGFGLLLDFDPRIPDWALRRAQQGEVVILTANTEDRVQALLRLEAFNDAYLIVGRLVDPRVLAHMDRTRGAAQLYEELEGRRAGVEITFALIFVVVALLLLLTAVWVGLAFANYLTRPIGKLIAATEKVRTGDLSARVQEDEASDEIGALSRAFNRMTGELQRQQQELLEANRQLDSRRRFIEAVLSGVSAGVIGLDREGNIELPNRSAGELLSADADLLYGNRLEEILPDVAPLIEEARQRPGRVAQGQLSVELEAGHSRTILARVVAEPSAEGVFGFVVTFDDITDL